MSEQQNKEQGLVKNYLNFLDTNILFKKPISCLYAIISLLIPISVLGLLIQFRIFEYLMENKDGKSIVACILLLIVLGFAGVFGALIWWHRRINRDEGPNPYPNFRRFIQTAGEWLGTVFAISVFGGVLVLLIFMSEDYRMIANAFPFSVPAITIATAFYGPVGGFIIIILTKILLFLLDPIIWLVKKIWGLIKRVALYFYRFIISFFGTVEKNTPFWVGATWVLAVAVIISALVLCFMHGGIAVAIGLVAALGFMAYLIYKRKHDA